MGTARASSGDADLLGDQRPRHDAGVNLAAEEVSSGGQVEAHRVYARGSTDLRLTGQPLWKKSGRPRKLVDYREDLTIYGRLLE